MAKTKMITETLLTLDFFKLQTAKNASNNLLFPTTKICMYIRVVTLDVLLRDGNNSDNNCDNSHTH